MEGNTDLTLKKLFEISGGYFRVTSREGKNYQETFGFSLDNLPKNALILDIGSGYNQELARWLNERRPDIRTFSIDPTLYFRNPEKYTKAGIRYDIQKPGENIRSATLEDIEERIKNVTPLSLVAIAPDLPFRDNSFDAIFDNHSAFMYLTTPENKIEYIKQLLRVTKVDGVIYIYPLDSYDSLEPDSIPKSKKEFEEILKRTYGFNFEYNIFEYDEGNKDKPNKRYGVKIIKK